MGSLALLPLGFALAGPLASLFGARTVLGVGGALGVAAVLLTLVPHSTGICGHRCSGVARSQGQLRYPTGRLTQPSSSRARSA